MSKYVSQELAQLSDVRKLEELLAQVTVLLVRQDLLDADVHSAIECIDSVRARMTAQ